MSQAVCHSGRDKPAPYLIRGNPSPLHPPPTEGEGVGGGDFLGNERGPLCPSGSTDTYCHLCDIFFHLKSISLP
jgi:hypothetical protein